MATAKSSVVELDKKLHAMLLHKLSGMLTKNEFRKLKHVFTTIGLVARADVDEMDDFFHFLALLERLDYISVGQYGVLIEHLETLELNECIRVIKEFTEKMNDYRKAENRGGAHSTTDEELVESRHRQMMEEFFNKKLQEGELSKQMEDLITRKLNEVRVSGNQSSPESETTNVGTTKVGAKTPIPTQSSSFRTPSCGAEGPVPSSSTREAKPPEPTRTQARYIAPPSADVNKFDEAGYTPLMRAAENSEVARVRSLIHAGADLDLQLWGSFIGGCTALIIASGEGHKEVVAELIKAGANLNIKDLWGRTALIIASSERHKEVVAELIKAGADLNIKDRRRKSALDYAREDGHLEIAEMLIRADATSGRR